MRIAFCDDEKFFVDQISAEVEHYFSEHNVLCVCDKFVSAKKLLLACESTAYDAAFLDVDMPEQNGIGVAEEIRKCLPNCIFIFISAYLEYAINGYYVNALRYILKSQAKDVLPACLDLLLEKLTPPEDMITLYVEGKNMQHRLSDILYFEGAQHYAAVYSIHNKMPKILASTSLTKLEQQLEEKAFLRIQKSLLVNMRYITSIKNYTVALCNGEQLKTSENNFAAIRGKYLHWKGESI